MRRFTCALLGVTALSFLAPAFAHAAAFFIDDTLATEQIRFSANDFELGLSLDGALFQQGTNNPATTERPEADSTGNPIVHSFQGTWLTTGAPLPPPVQVAFIEPGSSLLSDVLFVQYVDQGNGFGQINGHFVSDSTEQGLNPLQYLTPGVPVTNWPESNGAFRFDAPFLTASATSDAEKVPEATSILILGLGACVGSLLPLRRRSLA